MAVEARRGCGYRKIGGLYLVAGGEGRPCCKLPHLLESCPCCGQGIKQTRGWTWVDPVKLLSQPDAGFVACDSCPAFDPASMGERVGLLWIGEAFYPTPGDFQIEAAEQGISRRLSAVPRDFKVGETWVLLAHPKAVECPEHTVLAEPGLLEVRAADACVRCKGTGRLPGIFRIFRPTRIEKIVGDDTPAEELEALRARGITPVIVPHDDPDHQPRAKAAKGNGFTRTTIVPVGATEELPL